MKILQLCSRVPYPPDNGGSIAMLAISHCLKAEGNDVFILCINTPKHHFDLQNLPPEIHSIAHCQIVVAPALNKLNCFELCGKATTVTGIIGTITEFALCFPTNANVIAITEARMPIAPKGVNLTDAQKILKKLLFPQLRRYLYAEILSCAAIANGDRVLFGELGVPVKKIPEAFTRKLPAPQRAYADTKLGRGFFGTGCEVIDHATKGYCTAFGDPDVDPDLWLVKVGGRIDKLPPMVPGTPIGWQKAAMGRAGVGYFSETVITTVPF